MIEAEWLASTDPAVMLAWLYGHGNGGPIPTSRRLRLFACACCRAVWDGAVCPACEGVVAMWAGKQPNPANCWQCRGTGRVSGLADPRSRRAVEVVERFADGLATEEERQVAAAAAMNAANGAGAYWDLVWLPCFACSSRLDTTHHWTTYGNGKPTPATQAALLREIFGNPFKPRLRLDAHNLGRGCGWLRWQDGLVPRLARTIYDERRWGDMPMLADALLEAGCADEQLLEHCRLTPRVRYTFAGASGTWVGDEEACRQHFHGMADVRTEPAVHARGCWALDLLLGKE